MSTKNLPLKLTRTPCNPKWTPPEEARATMPRTLSMNIRLPSAMSSDRRERELARRLAEYTNPEHLDYDAAFAAKMKALTA